MHRPVEKPAREEHGNIRVRVTGPEEAQLWTHISARGWTHEHPEFLDFLEQTGAIASAREQSSCFLAELDDSRAAPSWFASRIAYTRTKWRLMRRDKR
jgi:hypothetical protein